MRCLIVFLFSGSVFAQFGGHAVVRGELEIEGATAGQDYQIEISDCTGGSAPVRTQVSGGNRFEFNEITPGCKIVRVVSSPDRSVVAEVQTVAGEGGMPVSIRVVAQKREAVAGVISADRLRHPMPKDAAKAINEANRLWQAGRAEEAFEKLSPMVERHPEFWEMQLNLAIIEMKLGRVEDAAGHFLKAHELQPRSAAAAVGAGLALLRLNRLNEAERAAEDAVKIEPNNDAARMLLARLQLSR